LADVRLVGYLDAASGVCFKFGEVFIENNRHGSESVVTL
jgi:hypothetical protein